MSPWMNTADVAEHLRYTGKHPLLSVYKFIKRHKIVPRYDGRRLLVARADVERAVPQHGGHRAAVASVSAMLKTGNGVPQ